MNREVGEVAGLGRVLRRGLAAPADEQLAEAPAHEARVGVKAREAVLRIEGEELLKEPGGFGMGPGEGGVDRTEGGREGIGLVKLEQPAADLAAARADGEQVEEMLILFRGAIRGEQALQGGGIEVLVLHAILLQSFLNEGIVAHFGNIVYLR
jgi:hypothetical protein